MPGALAGIRVIDFTWVVAGPVTTRVLAGLGAEVIKVERKIPGIMGPRRVGLQGDINRGKRSVAVNMALPRGVDLARRLVMAGDIVIDNFSARVMRQWGMDYESLCHHKPDIICLSMSGLGHTGPRTNFVSYGPTLQALAGYTLMMADQGGEPAGWGYSYADMSGGYSGALAALLALWHRKKTGRGQFIDLSQFEAVTSVIGPALLDITVNGNRQTPALWRSQEGLAAPHGVYRCRAVDDDDDRWVAISVRTHAQWRELVAVMGSLQLASDPRFATLYLRGRNARDLDQLISQWTRTRDAYEVMEILQGAKVPAGVVANGIDLCRRDPHLAERGFWPTVELPDGGHIQVTGTPFRLSATPPIVDRCAPEIGEDNDYVLANVLGLGPDERRELIDCGAVWPA